MKVNKCEICRAVPSFFRVRDEWVAQCKCHTSYFGRNSETKEKAVEAWNMFNNDDETKEGGEK